MTGNSFLKVLLTAVLVGLIAMAPEAVRYAPFNITPAAFTTHGNDLPAVGSYAKLKRLLKRRAQSQGSYRGFDFEMGADGAAFAPSSAPVLLKDSLGESESTIEHSTTNVQVQGVDEADIVKTDGKYIYQIRGTKITVTKAVPAAKMTKVDEIDLADGADVDQGSIRPMELYVEDGRLIVVVQADRWGNSVREDTSTPVQTATVLDYILDNGQDLVLERKVEVEGAYLSSRKIGPVVYMVANKRLDPYYYKPLSEIFNATEAARYEDDFKMQSLPPAVRDSAGRPDFARPDLGDVRYFPDSSESNYLTVAAIDIDRTGPVETFSYLGGGEQIYASKNSLYVALTDYKGSEGAGGLIMPGRQSTVVHKFSLAGTTVDYRGRGEVPGRILNQFSMDEHDGLFRIATTTGDRQNNLYVLDESPAGTSLKTIGRLEGLAPGESIYSVRFMGDRAYMVTFKKVDPLFVIDLKDPRNPGVLGKLKIPGYSDYLHPLDENHIIGFGKDASDQGDFALYQGMKVAVFDVSDVSNPIEKWKTVIGDRGTESPLLNNHRALLFDFERRLLAFPASVVENPPEVPGADVDSVVWQGLLVYRINADRSLTLRGKISHREKILGSRYTEYGWRDGREIVRGLYIRNTLYSVSGEMIKANDLGDLDEIGALELGPAPDSGYYRDVWE